MRILGPFLSRDDQDEYTKVVLKNGLTLIVYERKDLPLVSISTYVKTGYLDEPERLRGIAHVVEHMFFKGTARRGVGALAKETKGLGGSLNAGTFYEYTHYYTVLPSEHFRQALDIQADALQNPVFAEEELKREIQVILQEARRKADSPEAFALEKLYETAFEVSPIRRWRIGDESTLVPLGRKELVDFYQRWYVPSNIVLVVCGNADKRAVLDEVVKKYGGMAPGKAEAAAVSTEPVQKQLRYRQLRGDIAEAKLFLGFLLPAAFTPEWYACQMLRAVLTEGDSSVLNRQLKEEKGWVSSVAAVPLDLKDQGYLTLRFSLDAARLDNVELAVWAELERLKAGALDHQDIERAKNLLERNLYLDREELTDFGFELARYEALASHREWRNSVRKIRAVTREQVVQAAKTYLTLRRCTVLEYLPLAARPRSTTAENLMAFLEQRLPDAVKEAELAAGPAETPASGKKGKPARPGVPPATPAEISSAWVDSPLAEYKLLRGPEVMVKESRALPLISIGVFFPGGRIFEGRGNNGITELMLRVSAKGAQKMSSAPLLSVFERNGARLETVVEADFFGYALTGLKAGFEKNLDALFAAIQEPQFEELLIQKEKALLQAEAFRLTDSQALYSRQLFKQALYGDHPYGLPPLGTPESMSRISRSELRDWHTQFVQKAIPVVLIAGDTEGSELVARLSGYMSTSGAEPIDLTMALPVRLHDRPNEKTENRERGQSATSLGFLTLGASEPETRVLTVIANLVSGIGGRFFEQIREKQALAYTVSAAYEPAALGGYFTAYVATSPENRRQAVDALKEQFKKLSAEPATEEEVRRGKSFSSGLWKLRLQRRNIQVFEFARLKIAGLSLDEIQNYATQFEFVRPQMIREAAQKYFDLSHIAIGGILGSGGKKHAK
ncbi:MAG: insulinase family protein [Acidobacteria bacterium]|nr:insulinase family protein [Acidobacteriota bacterium]MCI0721831.1 insulinase family protein [Acidobacteriota bacterium]